MESNRSLLTGRSYTRTRQYLVVAAAIFVGTLGLMGMVRLLGQQNITVPINGALLLWTAAIITIGAPAVQAYQNEGLLVSLVLGLSLPLAFYLVLTTFNLVYPSEDLLWGLGTALQFGVPAGILGFLFGISGRRAQDRRSPID